jgi:ABC-type tungstate transport system permease subunit
MLDALTRRRACDQLAGHTRSEMLRLPALAVFAVLASTFLGSASHAEEKSIVVASTTSTEDSGLFRYILPLFKAKTGIAVKVLAQGTGQALDTRLAPRGTEAPRGPP